MFDALIYALAELDELGELMLASVVPAPNASRMLVTLVATTREGLDDQALAAAHACIDAAADLREEVAAEITRQRVPELVFRIAPRAELDAR